jgi:hypothetical protein
MASCPDVGSCPIRESRLNLRWQILTGLVAVRGIDGGMNDAITCARLVAPQVCPYK